MSLNIHNLFYSAADLYRQQKHQPSSPGEFRADDAHYYLCAASCVAFIGLKIIKGNLTPDKFVKKLSGTNDKKMVEDVFHQLGLEQGECMAVMMKNDSCLPSLRREKISSYLISLHASSSL